MEPLSAQLYSFGVILLAGIILGIFFDLFRVIRGLLRPGLISTPILDLLFWVLLTPLLVLYLLLANWGELRFYVFIGLGLGLFFYKLLLSQMVITFIIWFVDVVGIILNFLFTSLLRLVVLPVFVVSELRFSLTRYWGRRGGAPWRHRPRLRWRK